MVGIFFQELKDKRKGLAYAVLLLFCTGAAGFLVMRWFPKAVTGCVMAINRSKLCMAFLGLEEFVTAVTYEQLTLALLTAVSPLTMYFVLRTCAVSYWRAERLGTVQYFYSLGITRESYWAGKYLAGLASCFVYYAVLYAMTMLLSQYGIPVKILREISAERVNRVMSAQFAVGLMCVSAGNLLGAAVSECKGRKMMRLVFAVMTGLCILPNVLSAAAALFAENHLKTGVLEGVEKAASAVRNFVPMHWVSPWNSMDFEKTQAAGLVWGGIFFCAVAAAVSVFIYRRKNIITQGK